MCIRKSTLCYFLVFNLVMIITVIKVSGETLGETHSRIKRKVVFAKSSKFFFRLNGKDTVLNFTDVFAHGWSIRINYDLPESIPKRHKFFKRDVHEEIQNVPNKFALPGISCILKHLCETISNLRSMETCGFFCQIGKIVERSSGIEAQFFMSFFEKCGYYTDTCQAASKDLLIDSHG